MSDFAKHVFVLIGVLLLLVACAPSSGDGHTHDHNDGHTHGEVVEVPQGQACPTIKISVQADAMSGWNLHLETTHFRFTPENASGPHVLGEGHAHIYVDGEKIARLYGEWFHIAQLNPGTRKITVSLNGNNHAAYQCAGQPVEDSVMVEAK